MATELKTKPINIPSKNFYQGQYNDSPFFRDLGVPSTKQKPSASREMLGYLITLHSPRFAWLCPHGSAGHGFGACSACALSVPQSGLQISTKEKQEFIVFIEFYGLGFFPHLLEIQLLQYCESLNKNHIQSLTDLSV